MSTDGITLLVALTLAGFPAGAGGPYFEIQVVDEATGRGVPLVELRTVNDIRYYTDSNGVVAFHEPGLMDQKVFFHLSSHGYQYPSDGFGYRGVALQVREGGKARVKIRRVNIAERLYRVTGAGIYRDSQLLGYPSPLRQPVLNALVFGSDSVVNAVYRGRIYWFWGDTNRPSYPLGNFHVPGATSRLPDDGGLDPAVGVDLEYFVGPDGFARETAPMPGEGPTWINGLAPMRGGDGRERLFAAYVKVRPGSLEVYQRGLLVFDDEQERFQKVTEFALDAPVHPYGHPFRRSEEGADYLYFADPYPLVRCRADLEHLRDPAGYEAFTCLRPGSRLDAPVLDRDAEGALRYGWKKDTPAVGPYDQQRLTQAGLLRSEEALLQLQEVDTGQAVLAHRGSVYWNDYRRRWVMIAVQSPGTSFLGEVWYAEADTPLGPWVYARKIVTHDRYSFYNPKQHPMFDQQGGRILFFEGTYTHTFSGNPQPTPRYDYNQIMYRLDLNDPRLFLPVPVYQWSGAGGSIELGTADSLPRRAPDARVAFFALDRALAGSVAVYGRGPAPLFYALPADLKDPPATAVPLYQWTTEAGDARIYAVGGETPGPGYLRSEAPVGQVWRCPIAVRIPWATLRSGGPLL